MYDLIIARSYIDVNSPMFKDKIGKLKNEEYINSLTPNIIFDHKELSFIFNALSTLDPLNVRNEKVDDFIIKFNNSTELIERNACSGCNKLRWVKIPREVKVEDGAFPKWCRVERI